MKRYERHGHAGNGKMSPTYRSWRMMCNRCHNPDAEDYEYYGGRGITVCDRWRRSFQSFLDDMGERPQGLTLDRWPNLNGNYEPDNCRWATEVQQKRGRRNVHNLTFGGETKTITEWSAQYGLKPRTLHARLFRMGLPLEKALVYRC